MRHDELRGNDQAQGGHIAEWKAWTITLLMVLGPTLVIWLASAMFRE